MLKFKTRSGDTLVEIALAIGVLGFVVAAVSAVMTSTLAASQYSLEDTMARNEIDVQAEAIRYIHNAYLAERNFVEEGQEYNLLWHAITSYAVEPKDIPSLNNNETCDTFYNPDTTINSPTNLYKNSAFIVNTHRLHPVFSTNANETKNIIIPSRLKTGQLPKDSPFQMATVYPRVLYGSAGSSFDDLEDQNNNFLNTSNNLNSSNTEGLLGKAEGIWVQVACSDNFANCDSSQHGAMPNYYDFYIRTCWESTNDHATSTIGTIVRLHNPDLDITLADKQTEFTITYYASNSATPLKTETANDYGNHNFKITSATIAPAKNTNGWDFAGWCIGTSYNHCDDGAEVYRSPERVLATSKNPNLIMVAVYRAKYYINYLPGASGVSDLPPNIVGDCHSTAFVNGSCTIRVPLDRSLPKRTNYVFRYFTDAAGQTYPYNGTRSFTFSASNNLTLNLTANWRPIYKISFSPNGSNVSGMPGTITPDDCGYNGGNTCRAVIPSGLPTRPGHIFLGWATSPSAQIADDRYNPGKTVDVNSSITLYAIWLTATNSEWGIAVSWTSSCSDIDSHTYVYNQYGTQIGYSWYGNKTINVGTKVSLDHDWTSPGHTETTTIDNLGSNSVYFCVRCYSGSVSFPYTNLRVAVSASKLNYYKVFTPTLSTSGRDWSVFRIRGNSVVSKNALSCSTGW